MTSHSLERSQLTASHFDYSRSERLFSKYQAASALHEHKGTQEHREAARLAFNEWVRDFLPGDQATQIAIPPGAPWPHR